MYKRADTQDLNIPIDDFECWERYPKHRWVYDLSKLLDAQHVEWYPFENNIFKDTAVNMYFESEQHRICNAGTIFINKPKGIHIVTEVYISKGEIKLSRYFDKLTDIEICEFIGNIELRINAFISIHFQKFSGIVAIETIGNDIVSIRLRPHSDITANSDAMRIAKRIYKKTDITLIGLTDQVIRETIAS